MFFQYNLFVWHFPLFWNAEKKCVSSAAEQTKGNETH